VTSVAIEAAGTKPAVLGEYTPGRAAWGTGIERSRISGVYFPCTPLAYSIWTLRFTPVHQSLQKIAFVVKHSGNERS
jgi:hypothetical protein